MFDRKVGQVKSLFDSISQRSEGSCSLIPVNVLAGDFYFRRVVEGILVFDDRNLDDGLNLDTIEMFMGTFKMVCIMFMEVVK